MIEYATRTDFLEFAANLNENKQAPSGRPQRTEARKGPPFFLTRATIRSSWSAQFVS